MKFRMLVVSLMATLTGMFALATVPAQATPSNDNPCGIEGWYVNPDEKDYTPSYTRDGLIFDGKDLIHHATRPLDFPDIKKHTLTFEATNPGKVLGKMETENPYSTIIQNEDGKFWSTAMTYDQEGGQGKPVENVSDLLDKPVKPGKVKFSENSHVVTFGVGYKVEDGSTTIKNITFHGTTYDFTCEKTSPTTPPATNPPVNEPTDPPAEGGNGGGDSDEDNGETLPVTGASVWAAVISGGFLLAAGVIVFRIARKRRIKFTA